MQTENRKPKEETGKHQNCGFCVFPKTWGSRREKQVTSRRCFRGVGRRYRCTRGTALVTSKLMPTGWTQHILLRPRQDAIRKHSKEQFGGAPSKAIPTEAYRARRRLSRRGP